MRAKILTLGLICLVLIACKNFENPYSPDPIIPELEPADVQIWNLRLHYYSSADPSFNIPPYPTEVEYGISGTVANIGELPAKNIKIISKIYDDSWNVLWEGEHLFVNPDSNASCLAAGEYYDFEANWEGLDITIFYKVDEDGRAIDNGKWDYNYTLSRGTSVTWED